MDYQMNHDFFDRFPVQFTTNASIINGTEQPLGHYAARVMNLDWFDLRKLDREIKNFIPDFHMFLSARTASAAALAQETMNRLWKLLGTLPVYDLLQPDDDHADHLFFHLYKHPDEVDDMLTPGTERNQMMAAWLAKLDGLSDALKTFIQNTDRMLTMTFEQLKAFKPNSYADAFTRFQYLANDILQRQDELDADYSELTTYRFSLPVRLSFDTIYDTEKHQRVFVEQMCFEDLTSFLYTDLYKGMMAGNLPRRCQNCNRYFLAMGAYNTLYCNEIAPGETTRTCRMVGAHKKEKLKSLNQPILQEYNRVYNRLKSRKNRGMITAEEWNLQVVHIQELKEAALLGEYSDEELKTIYDKI